MHEQLTCVPRSAISTGLGSYIVTLFTPARATFLAVVPKLNFSRTSQLTYLSPLLGLSSQLSRHWTRPSSSSLHVDQLSEACRRRMELTFMAKDVSEIIPSAQVLQTQEDKLTVAESTDPLRRKDV